MSPALLAPQPFWNVGVVVAVLDKPFLAAACNAAAAASITPCFQRWARGRSRRWTSRYLPDQSPIAFGKMRGSSVTGSGEIPSIRAPSHVSVSLRCCRRGPPGAHVATDSIA